MRRLGLIVTLILASAAAAAAATQPITIAVDARDSARGILHSRLELPVAPGPLTLLYPKWIPGEHGPTGPITNLAGIEIRAGGRTIPWRRDDVEMTAFHLTVPEGVTTLAVSLDYLAVDGGAFSAGRSTTPDLAVVSWNQILLYPAGHASDALTYAASLTLPDGWELATALPISARDGARIRFAPVSLTTLVDSPVLAGVNMRTVPLGGSGTVQHFLHLAADGPEALAIGDDEIAAYRRLVTEALALFGATHYPDYHFLMTLSDNVEHFGLEHHASSDDRVDERTLIDPDLRLREAGLLPHEFVHSWNGKYRRPAGLATPDYAEPMKGDLLWVYEGLTSYLGMVLTGRSGLWTPEQVREDLALTASTMDLRAGRRWRPLLDTAVAAQTLYGSPQAWQAWRRGVDFYPEGVLLWLEVDTTIRRLSGGARSIDDFCRAFFGPPSGPPVVVPYTFDDLVAALAKVEPYDWKGFFDARLDRTGSGAPLGGVEQSGWKLAYSDVRNAFDVVGRDHDGADLSASLGCELGTDGRVIDVVPDTPADRAGVAPGTTVIAIGGRRFSPQAARDAVERSAAAKGPLTLVVEKDDFVNVVEIDYHGGNRWPHLERIPGTSDLLGAIVAPHGSAGAGR